MPEQLLNILLWVLRAIFAGVVLAMVCFVCTARVSVSYNVWMVFV
jgi:hypothetical protein